MDKSEEVPLPRPPVFKPSPEDFSCVCCDCGARYGTQWELLRHVRHAHPGADVAYVCWHCEREFTKFYRLIRHVVQGLYGEGGAGGSVTSPTCRELLAGASTSRSPLRDQPVSLSWRPTTRRDALYGENVYSRRQEEYKGSQFYAVAKRRPLGQSRLVNS